MRINPDLDFYLGDDSDPLLNNNPVATITPKVETSSQQDNKIVELLNTLNNKISALESRIDLFEKKNDIENNLRIMKNYKVWFIFRKDNQFGPFSLEQVLSGIKTNKVLTTDKIWCMQLGSPQTVSECKFLRTES